jgi:UDP-glucose 4-epimerase
MAHILVTGASGFIGLAVTRALAARQDRVTAFDVAIGPGLAALAEANGAVQAVQGELLEWPRIAGLMLAARPDAVIHCAAVVGVINSVRAPMTTMRINVEGSMGLLEAMRLAGVRRMLHISSEETYGPFQHDRITEDHPQNPVMAYGISKLAVEHMARSYRALHGIETVHLRTSWVYGFGLPRQRVPKSFIDAALDGRHFHLPAGADLAVDNTYIDDIVAALLLALDLPQHPFDAYNIGSGVAPRLDEIAAMVRDLVPGAGVSVGPGAYDHGRIDGIAVPSVRKGALDVSRARVAFGYVPRFGMRRGLEATIAQERVARR